MASSNAPTPGRIKRSACAKTDGSEVTTTSFPRKANELLKKGIARHEIFGGINDFCLTAKRLLKYGGSFVAVYRPDRLTDLISAMRQSSLEPKRITFVHADCDSESSMVLVEGKSGGKSGMILTPPLLIYKDNEHKEYTSDMNYIMENGSFPKKFMR